jgi:hypothetical protein
MLYLLSAIRDHRAPPPDKAAGVIAAETNPALQPAISEATYSESSVSNNPCGGVNMM